MTLPVSLHFSHIDVPWISHQHEQRGTAYPYASVEVPETSRVVIGSVEEVAVGLGQEVIVREGKKMIVCDDLNTNGLSAIRQVAA